MKQWMKQWMILAAIMAISSAMVLTSCKEDDDELLVTDDKPWTISSDDMDTTVKPGDDFFMYCNGGYWNSTSVREDTLMITSFLRNVVMSDIKKKIDDLTYPSLETLKGHKSGIKPTKEELEAFVKQRLQPLEEATTLEDAWRTTGKLAAEGLTFNFDLVVLNYHSVLTAIMFPKVMDLPMPNLEEFNERINSPGYERLLTPLSRRPKKRGAEDKEWPMLAAWCEGLGVNPEHVMTWKTQLMLTSPEVEVKPHVQKWDDELMDLQAMDLETYKQTAYDIFLKFTVKDMEQDVNKTAEEIYNKYGTYEKNRIFAEHYLTPDMIDRGMEICMELKQTFANRISRCTWMSEASRVSVLDKLDAMEVYVGQPDYWIEDAMPDLSKSQNLAEDLLLLSKSRSHFEIWFIGKPNRGHTFNYLMLNNSMNVYEVNAAYMAGHNAIMIMATMIMPPLFPKDTNEAIIYATASVFGHEMTHGFDSSGSMYDKNGEKNSIFIGQEDLDKFKQLSQQLADCYSSLEVMPDKLPGVFNDGNYTLGENIADLGGLEIAFEAYTDHLKRQGFKGDQLRLQQKRFYLAFAHLWQAKYSAIYAQERTKGRNQYGAGKDEHSLERERLNGVSINTDAWYDLFDVKPGDKLYLKPEERTHIW